jgi:HD-GYP domain-containing protein (c-di-GMP phosphodiesterase class II)
MAYSINYENINRETEVINQLAIFLRTAKVHDINNTAVIAATDKFISLVNDIISLENSMVLEIRGEYFYFNENRIRYSPEYILNLDYLIREFKKADLGTILVKSKISREDIRVFIGLFLKAHLSEDPFFYLKEGMSDVPGIELKKIQEISEENLDKIKIAKKTYFNAVSFYREIFNKVRTDEKINLKKAKRVITSVINQIIEQEQILLGMTTIKDYDEYTYHHSTNVSILSLALGRRMGMNHRMLIDLGIVSLFHDLGKIVVPNEILNKPSKLTDSEWRIIRKHPIWGVNAILKMRNIDDLTINAAIVAFEHHMNIDHTGYPRVENPAPLDFFSRIVSIVDQYDAMTSKRVYTDYPKSPDTALRELLENSGDTLDPLIVKFFVNMIGIYPIGTLVVLNSGELGLVFENNQDFLHRPRVMIISDNKGNWIKGPIVDLADKNGNDGYLRTIIKTMNPKQYNINLAEYLL